MKQTKYIVQITTKGFSSIIPDVIEYRNGYSLKDGKRPFSKDIDEAKVYYDKEEALKEAKKWNTPGDKSIKCVVKVIS